MQRVRTDRRPERLLLAKLQTVAFEEATCSQGLIVKSSQLGRGERLVRQKVPDKHFNANANCIQWSMVTYSMSLVPRFIQPTFETGWIVQFG